MRRNEGGHTDCQLAVMYVVRGVIAPHGANYRLVGQFTYLSEPWAGWWVWDGLHKAREFFTENEAMDSSTKGTGPWFRLPSPETIEVVSLTDQGLS